MKNEEKKETENVKSKKILLKEFIEEITDPKLVLNEIAEILIPYRIFKLLKQNKALLREKGNSWVLFWEDKEE